ncbi:MAG: hypothetical protein WAW86_09490 [Gammaproteobacteria bacterium]
MGKTTRFGTNKTAYNVGIDTLDSHRLGNPVAAREDVLKRYAMNANNGKNRYGKPRPQHKTTAEKSSEEKKIVEANKSSVKVYYDENVFIRASELNTFLSRSTGYESDKVNRSKTKHRVVASRNHFYYTDNGTPANFDCHVISGCAPNLRSGENPGDAQQYLDAFKRLKQTEYKQAMQKIWASILFAANDQGSNVVISPALGCGAYTRHLSEEDKKITVRLMAEALADALKEAKSSLSNIKEFILSIPQESNGSESSFYAQVADALKNYYQGAISITLTDSGMLVCAEKITSSGGSVAIINPSSDYVLGGGYTDTRVGALEEQLFSLSDLSEVADGDFNKALLDPKNQVAMTYSAGKGYGVASALSSGSSSSVKQAASAPVVSLSAAIAPTFAAVPVPSKPVPSANPSSPALSGRSSIGGVFVPFELKYGQTNNRAADNLRQARAILEEAKKHIEAGHLMVGITYGANDGQRQAIRAAYGDGSTPPKSGTAGIYEGGANQAEVMLLVHKLMDDEFKSLKDKFFVLPVTTAMYGKYRNVAEAQTNLLVGDVEHIESFLKAGGVALGWQNQDSVDKPKALKSAEDAVQKTDNLVNQTALAAAKSKKGFGPYAVGGGVITDEGVSDRLVVVQERFAEFEKSYRMGRGISASDAPLKVEQLSSTNVARDGVFVAPVKAPVAPASPAVTAPTSVSSSPLPADLSMVSPSIIASSSASIQPQPLEGVQLTDDDKIIKQGSQQSVAALPVASDVHSDDKKRDNFLTPEQLQKITSIAFSVAGKRITLVANPPLPSGRTGSNSVTVDVRSGDDTLGSFEVQRQRIIAKDANVEVAVAMIRAFMAAKPGKRIIITPKDGEAYDHFMVALKLADLRKELESNNADLIIRRVDDGRPEVKESFKRGVAQSAAIEDVVQPVSVEQPILDQPKVKDLAEAPASKVALTKEEKLNAFVEKLEKRLKEYPGQPIVLRPQNESRYNFDLKALAALSAKLRAAGTPLSVPFIIMGVGSKGMQTVTPSNRSGKDKSAVATDLREYEHRVSEATVTSPTPPHADSVADVSAIPNATDESSRSLVDQNKIGDELRDMEKPEEVIDYFIDAFKELIKDGVLDLTDDNTFDVYKKIVNRYADTKNMAGFSMNPWLGEELLAALGRQMNIDLDCKFKSQGFNCSFRNNALPLPRL